MKNSLKREGEINDTTAMLNVLRGGDLKTHSIPQARSANTTTQFKKFIASYLSH